ncbi:M23 family metallopeptidase [Flavobacterium oreochromis]|uniref:M23 family metallopeptidase n=1 Tax=Flavobacterium oreochromis TaxID=2906078 RepID=UPI00385F3BB3
MKKTDIESLTIQLDHFDTSKDSKEFSEAIMQRLEKIAATWENEESLESLYLKELAKESSSDTTVTSTSTRGGATANTSSAQKSFAGSTTPSGMEGVSGGKTSASTSNTNSSTTGTTTSGEGFTDAEASNSDSENSTGTDQVNSSSTLTSTTANTTAAAAQSSVYSSITSNETIPVPATLSASTPTDSKVLEAVKKKREEAILNNDAQATAYWNDIISKIESGITVATLLTDDTIVKHPLFDLFKTLTQTTQEVYNFDWDSVSKKMINAIEQKIVSGTISAASTKYWNTIKKKLQDPNTNIANLFEEYDELFLLLKEVEGLSELPNKVTFFTKTKVYPNLSPNNMYADLGTQTVYTFLKRLSEKQDDVGAGVKHGGVYIKNCDVKSFITGETLEFGIHETFINQLKNAKENINWIVYKDGNKKNNRKFVDHGTTLSYNFGKPGKYTIEAYGKSSGALKSKKTAAFVEVTIINQEIVVTAPQTINGEFARPFTTEKPFVVKLKENTIAKPLQPVVLSYQIEHKIKEKRISITDSKVLPNDGVINLAMPQLGTYTLLVNSNDQYAITCKKEWKIIENYVEAIEIINNKKPNNVYLHSDTPQEVTFAVKKFKIEPPTPDEVAKVKWLVYNAKGSAIVPKGLQLTTAANEPAKPYIIKGKKFTFKIPQNEGEYYVHAYCFDKKKSKDSYKIEMVTPRVTEASWTDAQGDKKETTGFKGEISIIKASIPNFGNQKVRVFFYVKKSANGAYSAAHEYYSDTTTDVNGNINKPIVFDDRLKNEFKLSNGENAFLKVGFVGLLDNKLYPFKEAKYSTKDVEMQLTTKRQLLDLYFEYDGRRVLETDKVPYDAKKKTALTLVAHTRNMTGEEIKFTMHKLGEDSSLEDFSAAKVNQDGIAKLGFTMKDVNQLKKGEAETYFAGIEGFSAKHIKNRTLVLQVGAKWDSNTIQHSLTWGNKVSKEFRKKVVEICMDLWGDQDNMPQMANGLMAVMYRETGKTFAPHRIEGKELKQVSKLTRNDFARFNEKGEVNGSRAVGLIQFTQVALVALGDFVSGTGYDKLHTVKLRYARMSQLEQLEKVRDYFKKLSKLPKTPEDIYSAVFAPDAVEKKNSDTIYQLGTDGYKRNKSLDENNNGIQKIELINKFYESLAEGNKRGNIAPVMIEKVNAFCSGDKCVNYADVWGNPEISSDNGSKNNNRYGYNTTRGHKGIDILSGSNYKEVHSLMCGTVGKIVDSFKTNEYKAHSLGNTLMIKSKDKNGNEIFILYCHLDKIYVKEGEKVQHGQKVALSGSTGNAAEIIENGKLKHGIYSKYWHCHIEAATKGDGYNNFHDLGSYRVKAEDYMKTKFDKNGESIK